MQRRSDGIEFALFAVGQRHRDVALWYPLRRIVGVLAGDVSGTFGPSLAMQMVGELPAQCAPAPLEFGLQPGSLIGCQERRHADSPSVATMVPSPTCARLEVDQAFGCIDAS
ncbi:hypothetical protein [Piscinibacter sakaiensis]|uniref:hypothetical protein n=1 Tax=Piscinibacter sakaiensis TaxID=1547922 RepID=UPI003AAB7170